MAGVQLDSSIWTTQVAARARAPQTRILAGLMRELEREREVRTNQREFTWPIGGRTSERASEREFKTRADCSMGRLIC